MNTKNVNLIVGDVSIDIPADTLIVVGILALAMVCIITEHGYDLRFKDFSLEKNTQLLKI